MNIAIVTAKGGNLTLGNKNIIDICGKPSLYYSIDAAKEAKLIDEVFVSTEDQKIKDVALRHGAKIIDRPIELAQPTSNHGDVILHGAKTVQDMLDEDIKTVTVLLGNTVMTVGEDIDEAIQKVDSAEDIDSCMTVWKAQDDHPFRAMTISDDGYLESFLKDNTPDTNRQSYPDVYFYDQGPWTVKMSSLIRSEQTREGPGAWWWMGKKCVPIERLWVTGRDTHSMYDVEIAEWWLDRYKLAGKRNPGTVDDIENKP